MLSTDIIDKIKRRGLEIAAEIEAKSGPYRAEIVPDCSPTWHLVRTAPAAEARASKRLIDRGFGVYLPMIRNYREIRGRRVHHQELFFPGYVFLFVWDVKRHWRRIKSCSGVQSVVCREEHPIIVPDSVIHVLQGLEFTNDQTLEWTMEGAQVSKKRRRRWRRSPKAATHLASLPQRVDVTFSTKSYWREVATVDADARLGALNMALGLASQRPTTQGQVSAGSSG